MKQNVLYLSEDFDFFVVFDSKKQRLPEVFSEKNMRELFDEHSKKEYPKFEVDIQQDFVTVYFTDTDGNKEGVIFEKAKNSEGLIL